MYIITAPIPADLATAMQPYRQQYSAQAALTPPYITIVPPFAFSGEEQTLIAHLRAVGETHAPIKVSLVGWDVHSFQGGFQLRLPLIGGKNEFGALRQHLLTGPLEYLAQPNRPYWPHIEFGQLSSEAEVAQAKYNLHRFEPKFVFRTMYFELQHRESETLPWLTQSRFTLEATVASSRRRQSTPEPLNLDKLTRN